MQLKSLAVRLKFVALALIALSPALALAAPSTQSAPATGLSAVLERPDDWVLSGVAAKGDKASFRQLDGRAALVVGPGGTVLTTGKPVTGEVEVTALLHVGLPDIHGTSARFVAGLKDGPPAQQALQLNLSRPDKVGASTGASVDSFDWSIPASPQWAAKSGRYAVWLLSPTRVDWLRSVRLKCDADFASVPHLDQRWITLRLVLRKHSVQAYLDGRLIHDGASPALDTTGLVRLTLAKGMALASLTIHDLPPEDRRYETVDLDHYLNSAKFAGQALAPGSPAPAHTLLPRGGVPMLIPAVDAQGNNHIDVGRSWNRAGFLPGALDPVDCEQPRWAGALAPDPSRIQFRIRNARYTALHLLAASDGNPNTVPIVSAQFYRGGGGHPVNFAARVPVYTATSIPETAVPIRLADGTQGNLFLITIPLEPDSLSAFADTDAVELELTKEVHLWRSFPEPDYYSFHGAGLPSSVHVFALTLERPIVDADFEPDRFAHVWTAPSQPSYTVTLRNATDQPQTETVVLVTTSKDDTDKTGQKQTVTVPPNGQLAVKLPLQLKKYGYHDVTLTLQDSQGTRRRNRSLAFLHPDTRERGNWEEGKGIIYGFWDWNGAHLTPTGLPRLQLAYDAGIETCNNTFASFPDDEKAFLAQHQMATRYLTLQYSPIKEHLGVEWDPTKPEAMVKAAIEWIKKSPLSQTTPINQPNLAVFLGEPLLGQITLVSLPEYFGEPPRPLTADEQKNLKKYMDFLLIIAPAIKKEWPNAKILWAYGIANFPIQFMRASKEAAALMDGPAIDMAPFEREPELQIGWVTLQNEMWQLQEEWKKHSPKPRPRLITIEGPAIAPVLPGALTQDEEAQNTNRTYLALMAYNVTQINGWPNLVHCAYSWGESLYGGGLCAPLPLLSPGVAFSAFATMTRQINRMNYVKWVPTGSNSVYCLQFKRYKTAPGGELLHVFWTLRGSRPVSIALRPDQSLTVFDSMDNDATLPAADGQATFTITPAPCFVHGLTADPKITLGPPAHPDAQPTPDSVKLTNAGDWHITGERDNYYESSHEEFIRRFPGNMTAAAADAPAGQGGPGGKALAIHLAKQEKERFVMPYYTLIAPPKPVAIPGRASHLGIWVKGNSDWGRVIYFLRDAKGQPWVSVGTKGDFNADDIHAWSQFCFDGWRYLRFELPANAPWDNFREAGRDWWGGPGVDDNAIVELPLTLEKIAVERRTHVIYVNDLVPADPADVLLGDIDAEYAAPADTGDAAVALSKLRMPPATPPDGDNPIAILQQQGFADPTQILKVELPPSTPGADGDDGRSCIVSIKPVPGHYTWLPSRYYLWAGPTPDGRGAVQVAKDWTSPTQRLGGMSPDKDFYLFAVSTATAEILSKPSPPFRVNLRELHGVK